MSKTATLTVKTSERVGKKDPFKIQVTVTNVGLDELAILWTHPHPRIGLRVYNSRSELIDVTKHGQKVLDRWSSNGKHPHGYVGTGHFERIKPGEDYTLDLDLEECFSFDGSEGKVKCSAIVTVMTLKTRSSQKVFSSDYIFHVAADE